VDSDTAAAISVRPRRKKVTNAEDTDPTPLRFRSNDLAMMLDSKNLDTLMGTTAHMGLSGASLARSATGLSGYGDGGRPGAGVAVSYRHDTEKGEETVPAITITDPEGGKSTSWTSTAAFAASLDIRRRIYGGNVLPSKSLLSFMHTALKDKVLVR
jgi:Ca2+-transporting ATPase